MESIDLFGLREHFNRSRILLCFNGPISRSLIEEIGNALKNYLQADSALPSAAMDVFSAYIEIMGWSPLPETASKCQGGECEFPQAERSDRDEDYDNWH